mgnify:CR=1 FL=1
MPFLDCQRCYIYGLGFFRENCYFLENQKQGRSLKNRENPDFLLLRKRIIAFIIEFKIKRKGKYLGAVL